VYQASGSGILRGMTRGKRKPLDPVVLIVGGLLLGLVGGFLLATAAAGLGWLLIAVAGVTAQTGAVAQGVALGMAWYDRAYRARV
jgi:hypothetical protein